MAVLGLMMLCVMVFYSVFDVPQTIIVMMWRRNQAFLNLVQKHTPLGNTVPEERGET